MYKINLFIIIILLLCNFLYAQQYTNVPSVTTTAPPKLPPTASYRNQDLTTKFLTIDPRTGKPLSNKFNEVNGYPFFTEDWKYSLVKLYDGKIYDLIKTRLDLNTNVLYFKTKENIELVFDTGYIREVNIYDSPDTKNITDKFQTGFPKIDNQNQNTYYQVLSEGKASLLNLIRKQLSVNKNVHSGEVEKRFETYENYYVFADNKIQRLKKDRDSILKMLSDKKNDIERFCNEKNINFKNINDIVSLLNYYNFLIPDLPQTTIQK